VQFIGEHLEATLSSRFSPLIYFWGTNPQTALFGYLQGQLSIDEMPRDNFRRQYIYVSDAQYLTSNVDLSQHYREGRRSLSKRGRPLELKVDEAVVLRGQAGGGSQLDENIRLALADMLRNGKAAEKHGQQLHERATLGLEDRSARAQTQATLARLEGTKDSDLASSGSSSDSGMFAGHTSSSSSSSSSSSASSLTDVVIETGYKCSCKTHDSAQLQLELSAPPISANSAPENQLNPREALEFGQCALDWHISSHRNYHSNKLVALISAGMTTGSDKKYVTDTVKTLDQLGYEVCVFIRRGVGGLKLSSRKFFSPAKWHDFEAAVESVRRQRPGARLVAVGFSFGSIELCRYLAMSGHRSQVDSALLISCPFDPEAGGRNMRKRALNRRIDAYLAKNLGKQLYQAMFSSSSSACERQRADSNLSTISNYNGSMVNLASLPKIKSLVDFEDNFNRVLQNYPSSEAYAADSRLQDHLGSITTPTLCLSSEDDFMAPMKLLPLEQIRANKNLCMILTKRGGHMAFIDGILWPKRPYFAQRIIGKYLGAVRESLLCLNRQADESPLLFRSQNPLQDLGSGDNKSGNSSANFGSVNGNENSDDNNGSKLNQHHLQMFDGK